MPCGPAPGTGRRPAEQKAAHCSADGDAALCDLVAVARRDALVDLHAARCDAQAHRELSGDARHRRGRSAAVLHRDRRIGHCTHEPCAGRARRESRLRDRRCVAIADAVHQVRRAASDGDQAGGRSALALLPALLRRVRHRRAQAVDAGQRLLQQVEASACPAANARHLCRLVARQRRGVDAPSRGVRLQLAVLLLPLPLPPGPPW